ncbi:MAG: HPF/RaiA family ribosome-associated protein [Pirellulales bacterium]|nr:HPF/RaiA family ribosome-associated protein [Pirellulales bacterium]
MYIEINTDHNIEGHQALNAQVSAVVESALSRFSDHITRVEIHLSDVNSNKKGGDDDIRCMIEVRIKSFSPLAVTHQAATLEQVVDGAVDKLTSLIETTLGRQQHQKMSRTDPLPPENAISEPSLDQEGLVT